jgi:hypothetical protein
MRLGFSVRLQFEKKRTLTSNKVKGKFLLTELWAIGESETLIKRILLLFPFPNSQKESLDCRKRFEQTFYRSQTPRVS